MDNEETIKQQVLEGVNVRELAKEQNIPYSTLSKKAAAWKKEAKGEAEQDDEIQAENNRDDLENLKKQNEKQKAKSNNFEKGKEKKLPAAAAEKKQKNQDDEEGNFFDWLWDFFIGY